MVGQARQSGARGQEQVVHGALGHSDSQAGHKPQATPSSVGTYVAAWVSSLRQDPVLRLRQRVDPVMTTPPEGTRPTSPLSLWRTAHARGGSLALLKLPHVFPSLSHPSPRPPALHSSPPCHLPGVASLKGVPSVFLLPDAHPS